MNTKKFFKTFLITVGILLLVVFVVLAILAVSKFNTNIGGGVEIEELDEVIPDGRHNVVLFGTDKSGLRADVIMVFSVSASDGEINLLSVPRDTKVKPPNYRTHKITETLGLGEDAGVIVSMVKEVTGIPIHDYIVVNFTAVEDAVDALGGVEFDVPQNMNYSDPTQDLYINLSKGVQTLNGDQAVQLLRFRRYPMGDIKRTEVQRDFVKAMFEQKASLKYFSKVDDLYGVVEKNIQSSMSYGDVLSYVSLINKINNAEFNTFETPYTLSNPYVIINKNELLPIVEEYFK